MFVQYLLTALRANSTRTGRTLVLSGLNIFTTECDVRACFPSAHIEMTPHDTQSIDAAHDAQSVDATPDRRSVSRNT